jgi:hypothetical protein
MVTNESPCLLGNCNCTADSNIFIFIYSARDVWRYIVMSRKQLFKCLYSVNDGIKDIGVQIYFLVRQFSIILDSFHK